MKPLEEPSFTEAQRGSITAFLRQSGYAMRDVLSLNFQTGIFLTRGGGKYRLTNGKVRDLTGPTSNAEERM